MENNEHEDEIADVGADGAGEPEVAPPAADVPPAEAEVPAWEPEAPAAEADLPEVPAWEPEAPAAEDLPEVPAWEPEAPAAEADLPEVPAWEPEAPAAEADLPEVEPDGRDVQSLPAPDAVSAEVVDDVATFGDMAEIHDGDFHDVDDEGEDEEDEPKGIKTSTKVVLVAAAWVLLTLFLVGQFSEDAKEAATGRLDAVAGDDVDGDGEPDEVVEEEAIDANGDGIIEVGEGIWEGVASAGAGEFGSEAGAAGGAAGGSSGSATYGATPVDPGSGPSAVPGAAPARTAATTPGSGGGSSATTTTPSGSGGSGGGSGGGGTATTTTTTTGGGGGGGGGGGDTTTTTAQAPPPASPIIFIIQARENKYVYPAGYGSNFTIPANSQIRFDNDEPTNKSNVRHSFTIPDLWDADLKRNDDPVTSDPLARGTYSYACKYHGGMKGTFTVS